MLCVFTCINMCVHSLNSDFVTNVILCFSSIRTTYLITIATLSIFSAHIRSGVCLSKFQCRFLLFELNQSSIFVKNKVLTKGSGSTIIRYIQLLTWRTVG
jgi:hypothetical protein